MNSFFIFFFIFFYLTARKAHFLMGFQFPPFWSEGGGRGELQQEIDSIDNQISNMKKRLSSIVRECKFDSVQGFYKEFDAAKKENLE